MAFDGTQWDSSFCSTKQVGGGVTPSSRTVLCDCQVTHEMMYGVFTPNMNSKYALLSALEMASIERKARSINGTYGMIFTTSAFILLMIVVIKCLDMRDSKVLKKIHLTPVEANVIKRLEDNHSQINVDWNDYLFQIQQLIRNPNGSQFASFFFRTHPITNLFGVYDATISRLERLGAIIF